MRKSTEGLTSPDAVTIGADRSAALFSYPSRLKHALGDIGAVAYLLSIPAAAVDTAVAGMRNLDLNTVATSIRNLDFETALNRVAYDAGVTLTTLVSDIGIIYSLSNFLQHEREERIKPLAVVTGVLGLTGSALSRTGKPDWVVYGFAAGAASVFLAFADATK